VRTILLKVPCEISIVGMGPKDRGEAVESLPTARSRSSSSLCREEVS
jgi:hypothetical protein